MCWSPKRLVIYMLHFPNTTLMFYGYNTTSVFLKLNCGDCVFRWWNTSAILVFHALYSFRADSILFIHVSIHFCTYCTKSIWLVSITFCRHSHLVEVSCSIITKIMFYDIIIRRVLIKLNLVSQMRSHCCGYKRCCNTFCISEYFFSIPICSRITTLSLHLLFRVLCSTTQSVSQRFGYRLRPADVIWN